MRRYMLFGINPVPWKSPNVGIGRRNGKVVPQVYKAAELAAYQEAIREQMSQVVPQAILETHERLALTFYLWRNAGTKADHTSDATNLQKALEDALQGVLFKNDRNIVHVQTWIMEQGAGVSPKIVIEIEEAPEPPVLVLSTKDSFAPVAQDPNTDFSFDVEEVF